MGKTYKAEEVVDCLAGMVTILYVIETGYLIMWSSNTERFETVNELYEKITAMYLADNKNTSCIEEFCKNAEVKKTINHILYDKNICYSLKK